MTIPLSKAGKIYLAIACSVTFAGAGIGMAANHLKRPDVVNDIALLSTFASLAAAIVPILLNVFPPPGTGAQSRLARMPLLQLLTQSALFLIVIVSAVMLTTLVVLANQQPIIKIGISLPFLGSDHEDAVAILRMINLAIEDEVPENKIGNFNLQVVAFDDNSDSRVVKLVSRENATDREKSMHLSEIVDDTQLAGIIGPFNSDVAAREIPTTNRAHVPVLSPANTADCLTKEQSPAVASCDINKLGQQAGKGSYFRLVTADSVRQDALADFIYRQNPAANIVIYKAQESIFNTAFADRFIEAWEKRTGVRPSLRTLSGKPTRDLETQIGAVPDVILYAGTGPLATGLYDAIQDMQKRPGNQAWARTMFVGPAAIMTESLITTFRQGATKTYAIAPMCFHGLEHMDLKGEIVNRYKNREGGKKPTPYSIVGYDAAKILIIAIRKALEDGGQERVPVTSWDPFRNKAEFRSAILDKLRNLNMPTGMKYEGFTITRAYTFKSNGDLWNGSGQDFSPVTIFEFDKDKKTDPWVYVPHGWNEARC